MPKIANIQLNSQDNIDQNLDIIKTAVQTAVYEGASLIVLPENACMMGSQTELASRFDKMVGFYGELAKTLHVHILAGTLPCPIHLDGTPTEAKFYQSSLLFNDMGVLHQRYDKIHLFRAMVADGVGRYDEGRTFLAGSTPTVAHCTLDGVSVGIGMTVCFDVRFPKLFGQLRGMGADIITVPSAFTHTTGQAHWQSLLIARALDSQCLVVGSAQGGTHHFIHKNQPQSRQTWGHAMMVNANGQIVASTNTTDCGKFAIVYADFDKTAQDIIRQNMPIFDCAVDFT